MSLFRCFLTDVADDCHRACGMESSLIQGISSVVLNSYLQCYNLELMQQINICELKKQLS